MKTLVCFLSAIGFSFALIGSANAETVVMRTTEALFQHLLGVRESFVSDEQIDPFEVHAHKAILEVLVSKSLARPIEDHAFKDVLNSRAYDILPIVAEVGLPLADDDLLLFFPDHALVVAQTDTKNLQALEWLVSAGTRDKNLRISVELRETADERTVEKFRFETVTKSGQSLITSDPKYKFEASTVLSAEEDIVDISVCYTGREDMEGHEVTTTLTARIGDKIELARWIRPEAQRTLVLTCKVQTELVYATQISEQQFSKLSDAIVRNLSSQTEPQIDPNQIERDCRKTSSD